MIETMPVCIMYLNAYRFARTYIQIIHTYIYAYMYTYIDTQLT